MRVAIVNEHVGLWRGGAERSTLEMTRHLRTLGIDASIVTSRRSETGQGQADVPVHYLRTEGVSAGMRTRSFVSGADELCRSMRFDVVHAITPCYSADLYQPRGGTYPETMLRSIAMRRTSLGRALKWMGNQLSPRRVFLRATERKMVSWNDELVVAAVSEYVRRQILAAYNVPAERVQVVFNGVDVQPLEPARAAEARANLRRRIEVDDRTPLVAFVAHNFRLKGLAELIRAAATPAGREAAWHAVIVGRDRFPPFAERARWLGVGDRFRWIGPHPDVREVYAAADCLAHPTWYDPCSRVVLEALAVGLPVVTTRFNGASEIMEPGRHGDVIDIPRDADALAAAVQRCLSPELRAACQAGAAALRDGLSMHRHARELVSLYHAIIDRR